jgi:hypothetical protein
VFCDPYNRIKIITKCLWIICFTAFFVPSANAHKAHHKQVKEIKTVEIIPVERHASRVDKHDPAFPVVPEQAPQDLIQAADSSVPLLCTSLELSGDQDSELINDNPVDLCCGHCDNVVPGTTSTVDPETKDKRVLAAQNEKHNPHPHTYLFGYTIYTDASPPTLLQGVLRFRVLLI